uniref:Uncharacterized protein n=1 Tax=Ciona intestinalis TaxID=7719 RepID=H2XWU0_CIOIN
MENFQDLLNLVSQRQLQLHLPKRENTGSFRMSIALHL